MSIKRIRWTATEDELLKQLFTTEPNWNIILESLPGRTRAACTCRGGQKGLQRFGHGVPIGPQPPLEITQVQAAYLAGYVDCDGTISLKTAKRPNGNIRICPYVGFSNTNKTGIQWIHNLLSPKLKTTIQERQGGYNHKRIYILQVHGQKQVASFLRMIKPYLVQKVQQAEIILGYCENHKFRTAPTEKELELVRKIRPLNKRGNPKYLLE